MQRRTKTSRRSMSPFYPSFSSFHSLMSSVPSLGQKRIIFPCYVKEGRVLSLLGASASAARKEGVEFRWMKKKSKVKKKSQLQSRRKKKEKSSLFLFPSPTSSLSLFPPLPPRSMATAACRASSAAGASCSGSSGASSRSASSSPSFRRVVAAVSTTSIRSPLAARVSTKAPISSSSTRTQAMGIGLGEEVGEFPTGRRIVLPGEDENQQRAFRPTFHSSPLLDPDFDVPKSHYGLTLKQMESLGLHEHALLNGAPDPVSE